MIINIGELVACKVKNPDDSTYFALGVVKSKHHNKSYTIEWLDKDDAVSHTSHKTVVELKNFLNAIMNGKTNELQRRSSG